MLYTWLVISPALGLPPVIVALGTDTEVFWVTAPDAVPLCPVAAMLTLAPSPNPGPHLALPLQRSMGSSSAARGSARRHGTSVSHAAVMARNSTGAETSPCITTSISNAAANRTISGIVGM